MFFISDLVQGGFMRDDLTSLNEVPTSSKTTRDLSTALCESITVENPDLPKKDCSPGSFQSVSNDSVKNIAVKEIDVKRSNTSEKKRKDMKLYKCTFEGCNATFPRPYRLSNHLLAHGGQKLFKCDEENCDKAYTSMSHLKRHQLTSHSESKQQPTFQCSVVGCGRMLKTRDILLKHMKRAHSEHMFACTICGMSFRESSQLESHSKHRHRDQTSHRCDKCQKVFLKLRVFNRHMRKHRLHVCQNVDCHFSTDDYKELRRHISIEHPRLHECATCGKKMKDKSRLRKHIRTHLIKEGLVEPVPTIPGNFLCPICNYSFATKGSLKRHIYLIHESPLELRLFNNPKTRPERAPRKDKGAPKRSAATYLSSVVVPHFLERALLNKVEHSTTDSTNQQVLQLLKEDIEMRTQEVIDIDIT